MVSFGGFSPGRHLLPGRSCGFVATCKAGKCCILIKIFIFAATRWLKCIQMVTKMTRLGWLRWGAKSGLFYGSCYYLWYQLKPWNIIHTTDFHSDFFIARCIEFSSCSSRKVFFVCFVRRARCFTIIVHPVRLKVILEVTFNKKCWCSLGKFS